MGLISGVGRDPAKSAKRDISFAAAAVTLVGSVVGMVFVVAAGQSLASIGDIRPSGSECYYEEDPGSGPSGAGHEEIDWSPIPQRVCVDSDGEIHSGAEVNDGMIELLSYPAALVLGPAIGFGAGVAVQRRSDRRAERRATTAPSAA